MRTLCAALTAILSGCIPARDNPSDPDVQPNAAIAIRVDGVVEAAGGRHALWELDGAESSDRHGIDEWKWSLSDRITDDCDDDSIEWLAAGEGEILTTNDSAPLAALLATIEGFAETAPGVATVERWVRLVVENDRGVEGAACRRITIVDNAPVVDLGPARRIAPGGKWWAVPRNGSVHDAEPLDVVIEPLIADLDPGDALLPFTPEYPGVWEVRGPLARTLDLDADGFVDDAFFDDEGRRRLRFGAPISPVRGTLIAHAGDSREGGAVAYTSTASVDVDVRSSHWVYDTGASELVRLDTASHFSRDLGSSVRVLATDGRAILTGIAPGLALFDHSFRDLTTRATVALPLLNAGAVADGAGGWWVQDGSNGTLHHFEGALSSPISFTDVEGTATVDFFGGHLGYCRRLAPATGTDLWILGGGGNTVVASPRLLRMSTSGFVSAIALPAPGAHVIARDGAGGAWIGAAESTALTVHHVDASGGNLVSETIAVTTTALPDHEVVAMEYDEIGDRLWVGVRSSNALNNVSAYTLLVRDPAGSWSQTSQASILSIAIDSADSTAIVASGGNGLRRYDASLSFVGSASIGNFAFEQVLSTEGGLVASHGFNGLFRSRLMGVEAGGHDPGAIVPYDALPLANGSRTSFAVDPLSGTLWTFRADIGAVESLSPSGERLASLPLPGGAGGRAALAIDPELRVLRVAWSTSAAGGFYDVALEGNPRAPHGLVPWDVSPDLREVSDLAAIPDGPLCVTARAPGGAPQAFVVSADGASVDVDIGGVTASAAADPLTGECWFASRTDPIEIVRASALGELESISDGVPAGPVATHVSAALDHWSGRLYVAAGTYQFAQQQTFLQFGVSGTPATAVATPAPTPIPSEGWTSEAQSLFVDPYHRSLFVGFSDEVLGAVHSGVVVRYELTQPALGQPAPELGRWGDFVGPRVGSTW